MLGDTGSLSSEGEHIGSSAYPGAGSSMDSPIVEAGYETVSDGDCTSLELSQCHPAAQHRRGEKAGSLALPRLHTRVFLYDLEGCRVKYSQAGIAGLAGSEEDQVGQDGAPMVCISAVGHAPPHEL